MVFNKQTYEAMLLRKRWSRPFGHTVDLQCQRAYLRPLPWGIGKPS